MLLRKTKTPLRVARKAATAATAKMRQQLQQQQQQKAPALDVSNIQRHFATHPTKFDLPKGTNLRITIKCVARWEMGGQCAGADLN